MNSSHYKLWFYIFASALVSLWLQQQGVFSENIYQPGPLLIFFAATLGLGIFGLLVCTWVPGTLPARAGVMVLLDAVCLAILLLLMGLSVYACIITCAYMLYVFVFKRRLIALAVIGLLAGLAIGLLLAPMAINPQLLWLLAPSVLFTLYALYLHNSGTQLLTDLANQVRYLSERYTTQMDTVNKLSKYMPSQLAQLILSGKALTISNRRKHLSVMFSDVVGFSELSERLDSHDLALFLNTYMEEMGLIAKQFGGTVDKFIGDAMVVFFGDPDSLGPEADACKCAEMAIAMRRKINELRITWQKQGFEGLSVRIGINSGYAHVGNYGHVSRLSYTAIGSQVNLASRLQSESAANQILISDSTYALIGHRISCSPRDAIKLKGFEHPVNCWQIEDSLVNKRGFKRAWFEANATNFFMQMNMAKMTPKDQKEALEALIEGQRLLEINIKHPSEKL